MRPLVLNLLCRFVVLLADHMTCLQMRRELAAAIRDLGKLIGHVTMLEYMVKMVTGYHHAWKSALAAAGGAA